MSDGDEKQSDLTPILDYRSELAPKATIPSHGWFALLLCFPAFIWLMVFLAVKSGVRFPNATAEWDLWFINVWLLAVITAIISLLKYTRSGSKRWFVWLNLAVNSAVLGVTAFGVFWGSI